MHRILCPALLFLLASLSGVCAAELKILTGAGMSMPVRALAADYGTRTGTIVSVVSDTAGGVQKRVEAEERYDLVIATTTVMQALAAQKRVSAQQYPLAQMVAGISARAGTPRPDLANAEALKQTLLAARSIAYVDPASGGITGVFFLAQADKIGIGAQVRARAVLRPNGTGVADAVATGAAQYGVTLVSEMLPNPGVTVWPLPEDVQMTTIYAAATTTDAQNALDAQALLAELAGIKGREAARKAGLRPVTP
jgi:molybdate transport system substrate-binding protein